MAVSVLTSSPKIPDPIKKKLLKLNLVQNEEKVGEEYFFADIRSFWNSLTRSLPKGVQEKVPVMHLNNHIIRS